MSLSRRVVLVAALTGAFIAAAVPTIGTGATKASAAKPANFRVVVNNRYIPNSMLAPANDTYITTALGRTKVGVVWQNDLRGSGYYVIVAAVGSTDRRKCVSGTSCIVTASKPLAHTQEVGYGIKIVRTKGNVVLSDKTVCLLGK